MKRLVYCAVALLVAFGAVVAQQKKKAGANDEAAIIALEHKWEQANVKADVAALDSILADTFISTTVDGVVRTKAELLGDVKSGEIKYETSKVDDLKVYVYGNAAVVNGRWHGKFVEKGKADETTERFTDTFVKQNGVWRCVASHASPIH
jgi:ketosteroid isomerase-like protein